SPMDGSALAAPLNDAVLSAGQNYLSAVLDSYVKSSQGSYGDPLKQAQTVVNSLAAQLEKAADPNLDASDRQAILRQVSQSKKSLQDLASAFTGLAQDSAAFDEGLETAVENLLKAVKGDVHRQLNQNQDALKQVASVVNAIADNTGKINENNLTKVLESLGDNINSLNRAFDLGSQALKALSTLAG
ncbi:MAG: hypothetical protein ACKO21_08905, partial [Nodosilinea sp.]